MLKWSFRLLLLIALLMPINKVFALEEEAFIITSYEVNIDVQKNNILKIKEKIDVDFDEDRHGIFRSIPIENKIYRNDGSKETNHAIVRNIKVSENYETKLSGNNKIIKIGSADRTVYGPHSYTISYDYDLGKDHTKDFDELYFNIIGNEWNTIIEYVKFTINMPDDFDASKIGFSTGLYGQIGYDTSKLIYKVNGNQILGRYEGSLNNYEGITVRLELPEGYFIPNDRLGKISQNICLFAMGVFLLGILLWIFFGRDSKEVETVDFYPPKELNSLEVGLIYKGYVPKNASAALLIDLARQGYVKIEEYEKRGLFHTKKTYKIIRLQRYCGDNAYIKYFMEQLFFWGHEENGEKIVTEKELKHSSHILMSEQDLINIKNRQDVFIKNNTWCKVIIKIMIIIMLLCVVLLPLFYYYGFLNFHIFSIPEIIMSSMKVRYAYFVCLLVYISLKVIMKYIPKRTKYSDNLYGKIKGFRTFLIMAEKDKLEALVSENPDYFYDILSYAYVLGVSNKWIKKFNDIKINYPTWYSSLNLLDYNNMGDIINIMPHRMDRLYNSTFEKPYSKYYSSSIISNLSNLTNSLSSESSSGYSGGGSSGGGSSGGGSGGGGGGSW